MQVIINGRRRMPTPERLWRGVARFAQTAATMRTVALQRRNRTGDADRHAGAGIRCRSVLDAVSAT
jgi:hypothetical protein